MQSGLRRVETDDPRLARLGLAAAMVLAAALLLWVGRDTSFFTDELEYFGRARRMGGPEPLTLTYLLSPFHGHLQFTGRVVYELLFSTAGVHYFWYRLLEVVLYLGCVALFFELARVRAGAWASLAASALLLFLGAGWEVMLWPFDLHTLIALGCGLGALLALERQWRWSDQICCALLTVAVTSIEVGFAFAVGVGVGIMLRPDRRRRIWIVVVPIALYLVWALWARRFGASQLDPIYLSALATSLPASLAATVASLTGLIQTGDSINPYLVGGLGPDLVIAAIVLIAFVWRISRRPVPPTTWVFAATLIAFWVQITLAHREPDTARYMLVDSVLLLLLAADLIAPKRIVGVALAGVCVVVIAALPLNLVKLSNGREELVRQTELSSSEYAMLELARDRVDPAYSPADSLLVRGSGAAPIFGLTAGAYFEASDRIGSLGMPLDELREAPALVRVGADASLIGAYELRLVSTKSPSDLASCSQMTGAESESGRELTPGGAVLRVPGGASSPIGLTRFADDRAPGLELASPRARWLKLRLPADVAPDVWRLHGPPGTLVCPAAGGA